MPKEPKKDRSIERLQTGLRKMSGSVRKGIKGVYV